MTYFSKKQLKPFLENILSSFPEKMFFEITHSFNPVKAFSWHVKSKINDDHKLIFVYEGRAFYTIEGKRFELREGNCLFIASGCRQSARPDKLNPPSFFSVRFKTAPYHDPQNCFYGLTTLDNNEKGEKLFRDLVNAASIERAGLSKFHISSALLCQALNLFYEGLDAQDNPRMHKGIKNVILMLNENHQKLYSVAELAKLAGLNERYFSARFKSVTGISPTSYMNRNRMRYAERMLSSNKASIKEIAEELGYSDSFSFAKQFKKVFAYSPGKAIYR